MLARRLELKPPEGKALSAALLLSRCDPKVPVFIRDLVERTALSELAVRWAVALLESKGLVHVTPMRRGVFITDEARDWEEPLHASQLLQRN